MAPHSGLLSVYLWLCFLLTSHGYWLDPDSCGTLYDADPNAEFVAVSKDLNDMRAAARKAATYLKDRDETFMEYAKLIVENEGCFEVMQSKPPT